MFVFLPLFFVPLLRPLLLANLRKMEIDNPRHPNPHPHRPPPLPRPPIHPPRPTARIPSIRQLHPAPLPTRHQTALELVVQAIHHLLHWPLGHEVLRAHHLHGLPLDLSRGRLGPRLDRGQRTTTNHFRHDAFPAHHERLAILYH